MQTIDKIKGSHHLLKAPPAKAYTLRSLILGSLAEGRSIIRNPLMGRDQIAVIDSLRNLGVRMTVSDGLVDIIGCGGRYSPVSDELDLYESGVGMNFLIAAANLSDKPVTLTGRPGLLQRPVGEIVEGMRQLGCRVEYTGRSGFPPVRIGGGGIRGGTARMSGAKNSQYFSSLAVSAPYAGGPVTIECTDTLTERPYFDITADMMRRFGLTLENRDYKAITVPNGRYTGREITVEGDYSSAAFFFCAAAVTGTEVTVGGLDPESVQGDKAVVSLLERMGCSVRSNVDGFTVTGPATRPLDAEMADLPDLVPVLAVTAAFLPYESVFRGTGHLAFKECNRLEAVVRNLSAMGAEAAYDRESLYVCGSDACRGADIDSFNDHRIAMSFAIAGLATGGMTIRDDACVGKSFPAFWNEIGRFYT